MSTENNCGEPGTFTTIPVDDAKDWAYRWQCENRNEPISFRFSKEDFIGILNEKDVQHVNLYPARLNDGTLKLLVVGVDSNCNDIIYTEGESSGIYDFAVPCPNICGDSVLQLPGPDYCPDRQDD